MIDKHQLAMALRMQNKMMTFARNYGKRQAFQLLSAMKATIDEDLSLTYENPTEEKE